MNIGIDQIFEDISAKKKMELYGAAYLSDGELLELLIKTNKELGNRILHVLKSGKADYDNFMTIEGMSKDNAMTLAASFEMARRITSFKKHAIEHPSDCLPYLLPYETQSQECFVIIMVNGRHEVIEVKEITRGTANSVSIHPRDIFFAAVKKKAAAIICAHNHPSGSPAPSFEDRNVTRTLEKAGKIMGIKVLDHLIISPNGYYSFLEEGLIDENPQI